MIYVLLTDGFEEIEAITPIDFLRRCGLGVKTASIGGKRVAGAHNITIEADISIDEVNKTDMSLLVLPGGPGHTALKCNKVYDLINYAASNKIPIGAICAAPSVIGEMGLLKGKKATCFPGFESSLIGANLSDESAVCDGEFITACGAGAAADFALLLAKKVCSAEKAEEIKRAMQYR